jgi:hypothetical protein
LTPRSWAGERQLIAMAGIILFQKPIYKLSQRTAFTKRTSPVRQPGGENL